MLINKWLITETIDNYSQHKQEAGICLRVAGEPTNFNSLYQSVQSLPPGASLALVLSGLDFQTIDGTDSYLSKLLGIFFLPAYCLVNYQPLVFVEDKTPAATDFLGRLNQKCIQQGIRGILIKEIFEPGATTASEFTVLAEAGKIDLRSMVKRWLEENVQRNNPPSIDLLVRVGNEKTLNDLSAAENELAENEEYKLATTLYQKQRLLEETNHQLYLKTVNEKNLRFYLTMQKKERTDSLKWYYYEYEILPTWFKQIGHVIKVIMGKRTFKSLFNDNVKKYKD